MFFFLQDNDHSTPDVMQFHHRNANPLLQSSSSILSLPQAPYQSESDDCSVVLQLNTGQLTPVNPRLRKRSLSPPSSVCLDHPSLCTSSHIYAELSGEDDMEASPPPLQPDLSLSEQCQTSEELRCSPGKRQNLESSRLTSPMDGTPVASAMDSHPAQLGKQ